MENFSTLIKNQYLKHPPSRLSSRYGFASLFVLTLLLIGFRYQLEVEEANLSLTHSVSNAYPDSGRTITHTSVITNNGPNDATNVTIKHSVSTSPIVYQASASSGPVAGTLSGSYPNYIVTWAGISIPSGTSVTVVSFISVLDNDVCVDAMGEIVSLAETDQDLTNNKMTVRICPKPTICQTITQPPGNVNIINSSCSTNCTINGGTITSPSTGCPTGYTLEYRVNSGAWSTTLPTYSQTGPPQTIETRCKCNTVSNYAVYQLTPVTTLPGICPDTDGDGVSDCNDGCPNDINKTSPGTCGCGVADTDSDGDGTKNCVDGCPNDANKIAPGQCGCGTPETNSDNDSNADCIDTDDDNDGLSDAAEISCGSNPLNANSTCEICDGLDNDLDGSTDEGFTNSDNDTAADCVDTDDDNDGILDAAEISCGSNPLNANSTCEICDGLDNDLDGSTDEGFTDSDNDGIKDCIDTCDFAAGTISNFNTTTCNCNPGYYPATTSIGGQTIITGCTPCPPGSYCPDGTNKYLCNVGTFSAESGKISCDACPMGTYQGSQGATLCINCPVGTYANTVGNSICASCPSGTNSPEGATSCTANDTDGDGTPDVTDGCPNDPNKITPGACGCSNAETDSDGDGTPNCNDLCPNDPNKIAAGTCGCGVPDTDSDGDGTPNCNDLCPNDPNKIAAGTCGCGVEDTDNDGDGTPNCNDLCPNDPNKIAAGTCGCGVADTDSDGDGTPNCNDGCPNDANKTSPGTCGCGISDTDIDGDGIPNCIDLCPDDLNKTSPGICGCGTPDTDCDGDGTPNCNDGCPNDANKTSPGTCGCGVADSDSDGDGIPNCNDGCPNDPNKVVPGACGCGIPDTDIDGDGIPNCNDLCPNDLNKTSPGICGCGVPDTDSDGDGIPNCNDLCPNDRNKIAPGTCGCGVADTDSDHDGTPNCNDGCPNDVNKTSPGNCGCGTADTPNCCPTLPDSDCDGVGNTCDVCPGGNDRIDNNNDGKPDCKYPPIYPQILSAWKCGNQKVTICHRLSRKNQTLCINYSDLASHIAHGDYLGTCNNATCGSGIAGADGTLEFELPQDLHALPIEAHLYPNPSQDQVIIEFSNTTGGKGLIEIIDITGKILNQIPAHFAKGTNRIRFDVNTLSSGLHFVRLRDQSNNVVILKMNKL